MKRFILLFFSVLLTFSVAIAQNWNQLGQDIEGGFVNEQSGKSVDFNAAGNIVVIGGYGYALNKGRVRVYQLDEVTMVWTQLGSDLYGDNGGEKFGYSVSISSDGYTIAVGSPGSDRLSELSRN